MVPSPAPTILPVTGGGVGTEVYVGGGVGLLVVGALVVAILRHRTGKNTNHVI